MVLAGFSSRGIGSRWIGLGLVRRLQLAALLLAFVSASPALAMRGPNDIADLADKVIDAVVNISASSVEESTGPRDLPPMVPGTPFNELFEEFYKRRGEGKRAQPRQEDSMGSGFVIDASGIIVTNNHVVGEADDITVSFNDGSKLKAEVVGRDDKLDLAVLKVKPSAPLKAVTFGQSDKLRIGDWVVAIGNPFGLGGSVTAGIVSARSRDIAQGPYDDYIQTDTAINRGNSGGPLFNLAGEVVGINTAILSPSGGSVGIGFAVPADLAAPTVAQLREFGETRRGWLGVRIQSVDDDLAEALGLGKRPARGVLVSSVDAKGPAQDILKAGDVVLRFNNREIREPRDLSRLAAAAAVGDTAQLIVLRGGGADKKAAHEETVKIVLGRLEDAEKSASNEQKDDEADAAPRNLGLELAELDAESREQFLVKQNVKGVLVTAVNPASIAADKHIEAGDVIIEVGRMPVSTPQDVDKQLAALREQGGKSILFLIAGTDGDVRFVAIPIE